MDNEEFLNPGKNHENDDVDTERYADDDTPIDEIEENVTENSSEVDSEDEDIDDEDIEEYGEEEDLEDDDSDDYDNDQEASEDNVEEEDPEENLRIMIVTADNIISGNLQIPEGIEITEDDTKESVLYNTLNCGNQFIALANSSIMDKDNTEFEPERVKFFVVITDIIQTCRIVPSGKR